MAQSKLQRAVFAFDDRIRYCGVLDEKGNTTSGGMRTGVKSVASTLETVQAKLQMAITKGMTETSVKYYGEPNYIIINREKLMFIAIPIDMGATVTLTAEPNFPLELVKGLIDLVKRISNR